MELSKINRQVRKTLLLDQDTAFVLTKQSINLTGSKNISSLIRIIAKEIITSNPEIEEELIADRKLRQ